jgi:hypothetical protein
MPDTPQLTDSPTRGGGSQPTGPHTARPGPPFPADRTGHPAQHTDTHPHPASGPHRPGGQPDRTATNQDGQPRLRPGQLTGQVHAFLIEYAGRFTAGDIAVQLGRSAGAVRRALDTLVTSGDAEVVHDRPRRYQVTPQGGGAPAPRNPPAPHQPST